MGMSFWTEFILYVHFVWVMLVVLPVPIIAIGGLRNWRFVRNPWFRYTHLGMMALVLLLTIARIECPLTTLENYFRTYAGKAQYEGSFMEAWVVKLLYLDLSTECFVMIYVLFFITIVVLLFLVKPHALRSKR